jgi:toxin ParE1/3/4
MSCHVINILASRDLNDIADYFTNHSVEAGEQFFREFDRRCQQLVNFPNLGKSYVEIRPNLRGLSLYWSPVQNWHYRNLGHTSLGVVQLMLD